VTTRRTLVPIVALWALAAVVAGCGDDAGSVTFGEGEIPGSVPGDFPVPAGAVVGSTLVDGVNHRTEFRFNVGQGSTAVIQFYTVSLVSAGYVVDRSEGDLTLWSIEFSRDTLRGSVLVQPAGAEVTGVVVSINRS
jgi:hypothetical protein